MILNNHFFSFFFPPLRKRFIQEWNKVRHDITTPVIISVALNENWGWLSTNFPNRT